MCIHSTRGAKQALFINAVGSGILVLLSSLIGVIIYAYYADCDPYTAKQIQEIDQILPYFVMEVFSDKKGLPGVFLACVFSGSLSTISSGLNSLAAVIIEDYYKGLMGRELTDERQGFIAKILSVILGVFVMLLTYVISHLGSILNLTLSIFGVLEGPNMGVFILGFFFPHANRRGALVGFLASIALQLWIFLGAQFTKKQRKSFSLPLSIANCTRVANSTLEEITTMRTITPTTATSMR
jgi:sodium-coupled monocarboxylate transporter 8/12